jgi:hypothetical protein
MLLTHLQNFKTGFRHRYGKRPAALRTTANRETATIYSPEWRSDTYDYITGQQGKKVLDLKHQFGAKAGGMEVFVKPGLTAHKAELWATNR